MPFACKAQQTLDALLHCIPHLSTITCSTQLQKYRWVVWLMLQDWSYWSCWPQGHCHHLPDWSRQRGVLRPEAPAGGEQGGGATRAGTQRGSKDEARQHQPEARLHPVRKEVVHWCAGLLGWTWVCSAPACTGQCSRTSIAVAGIQAHAV